MNDSLRISQLYPEELGVTGDRGNVRALQVRAERAGLPVTVERVGRGDALVPGTDILVVGNGPLSAMRQVVDDLRGRSDLLRQAVADGTVVVAVGAGAELLSAGVSTRDGDELAGLDILPFRVRRVAERRVGYIVVDTGSGDDARLLGFEDHASEWTVADGTAACGTVTAGRGSWQHPDGTRREGVRVSNAYAVNIQGPMLPLNPAFTDTLLSAAASRRGWTYETGEAHRALDEYAAGARAAILTHAAHHFTAMDLS